MTPDTPPLDEAPTEPFESPDPGVPNVPRGPLPSRPRIGHYRLRRTIAAGGMGTVHEAVDENLKRTVAIKVMNRGVGSPAAIRRFEIEAQVLARLRHPGIAQVYDAGVDDTGDESVPYFVMEHLPQALPLTEFARARHLDHRARLELFTQVCDAVHYGHQHGVIHRDLKPDNILVEPAGNPKIIDFGIAATTDADLAALDAGAHFVGTLQYMSPEQFRHDARGLDARSDVYALGVVLFELLAGRPPYVVRAGRAAEAQRIVCTVPPARLGSCVPALRGDIATIVHRALAKSPGDRFESAAELAAEIRRALRGEPIETRRGNPLYVARARTRRTVARHPVAAVVLAIAASATIAGTIGVRTVFAWTPLNRWFEYGATALAGAPAGDRTLETVRVITLDESLDVESLAAAEGLTGVTRANPKSVRRLHGRLMEKLARAGPRAVVFDITFIAETPFDADFARGASALRDAGVDVIVAVRSWALDDDGLPPVSRAILPTVRWGGVTTRFNDREPWRVELVVQPPDRDPMASIALTAVAACRAPGAEVSLKLDAEAGTLDMRQWRRSPIAPHARIPLGDAMRIQLSDVLEDDGAAPHTGIHRGDLIGNYLIEMPADDALAAVTVPFADAFTADAGTLEEAFAGRTIVIGSGRRDLDRWPHPDGRTINGCFGHAVAIDALLGAVAVRLPRPAHIVLMLLGAALVGALTGIGTHSAGGRRAVVFALLTAFAIAASVTAYRRDLYLANPLVPLIALGLAAEFTAAALRCRTGQFTRRSRSAVARCDVPLP